MMSHPHLDPTGQNSLNCDRKVKLSAVQFFEQRIKNINPSFAETPSFVFAGLGRENINIIYSKLDIFCLKVTLKTNNSVVT